MNELLWGYEAPVLDAVALTAASLGTGANLTNRFPGLQNNFTSLQAARDKGRFKQGIGAINPKDINFWQEWHGMSNLIVDAELDLLNGGFSQRKPWCQGNEEVCTKAGQDPNEITGYAGVFFPANVKEGTEFRIWVPQVWGRLLLA